MRRQVAIAQVGDQTERMRGIVFLPPFQDPGPRASAPAALQRHPPARQAEPRFARLPMLLISGDSDPMLRERALAQGADAFFPKPYSPSAVRKKLEQLLC